jgi:hypothetical protein
VKNGLLFLGIALIDLVYPARSAWGGSDLDGLGVTQHDWLGVGMAVDGLGATQHDWLGWLTLWADLGLPTSNHPPKTGEWLKTRAAGNPPPSSRAIEFSTPSIQLKT